MKIPPDLEQKIAERVEDELKQCLDNAAEGLHWVGPDGTILWANQTELNLLGYSREEYIGHNITEFHVDPPVIEDILARLTRGDTLLNYDARLRRKDGSVRYVQINSNVLWRDNQFLHTRCFTRDITDRRAADELALRLADIVENSLDAIISHDLDGLITSWNPAAERMYGYTAAEVKGHPIGLIIPPDRADEEAEVVSRVRRGERVAPFDTARRRKDGSVIDVALTISPIRDRDGRVVGASKTARDVSQRRRVEAQLQESEHLFRALANSIANLAWMARPDGWIYWYNDQWYAYTGTTEADMAGWGWERVHDPAALPAVKERWQQSINTGTPFEMVFPLRGADGSFRRFLTRVNPVRDSRGQVAHWFGTNTDVENERRMTEANVILREREQVARQDAELQKSLAESASRAKDEFLAMLGHELRNPLSPILTALQLMKLRGADGSERERTVIERQVTHLTRLVDDLLDVSRIARGKVELKEEVVEMAFVVAKAIEMASPLLEQRTQTLAVDVARRGLAVQGDPTRLSQVVSNLLTNAAKYTPPGGHITVGAELTGGEVVLRVRDTGIGIAADVLPHIFDLFVQERQAIDRSQGGLGLGLTIVRSLVERHRGSVSVHSDGPGRGSEFVIRLPEANAAAAVDLGQHPSRGTAAALLPAGKGRRILVVDDNQDAAEMLAAALRMKGHVTMVAHDAPAALDMAPGFIPDVAFLDIGLPVMDGYELAARLRELPGLSGIRLIAVTGYGQESDRRKSQVAGFHHHLVKPVDLDVVDTVVWDETAASPQA